MSDVSDFFKNLFSTTDWPARWHCGKWTEFHGWLYILSDLLIWSAYFTIPIVIIRFLTRKKNIKFTRLYFLFAAFILACGATHFLDAVAFWIPAYRLSALVRFITGVISWFTVFQVIKQLPVLFTLKPQEALEAEIEQRKRSEDKFKALLEAAPDAMIIADENGLIVLINRQTEYLFGYNKEELIGKPLEILIPVALHQAHVKRQDDLLQHPGNRGMEAGMELEALKKDKSKFPVEISLSPLITDEGTLISTSVRDITEKKKAREEIKKLNIELEERVVLRTDQLKKTNEELEAFSYSISHDLRAPLRGIIGFTNILEEEYIGQLDDEARRISAIIKSNAIKMGNLIDDLLNFSHMGRLPIVKTGINNNDIVKEVIAEITDRNPDAKIDWVVGELPDIKGDPSIIRQVWVNLISNAVKYSSSTPHARIEIGFLPGNNEIIFFVKDNGVGFDEKYKDKLFKVFQRLHSAVQFEGTGVGLAIVEKIITRHGGKVWGEGKVDEGAGFYFSLPGENKIK